MNAFGLINKMENVDEDEIMSESVLVPPSLRDDAPPLAGSVNQVIENIDIRKIYPDFHPNKILRFSRLLGASSIRQTDHYCSSKPYVHNSEEIHAKIQEDLRNGVGKPFEPKLLPPPSPQNLYDEATMKLVSIQIDDKGKPPAWRFGPSQIWYDRMNVPSNPKNFDYGLKKLKNKTHNRSSFTAASDDEDSYQPGENLPDSSFLPVTLSRWEDDIFFDIEAARESFLNDYSTGKLPYSGFIPMKNARTYHSFVKLYNKYPPKDWFKAEAINDEEIGNGGFDANHSMFPAENYELEHTTWEDDIIWDPTELTKPPEPKVVTFDFEDDPKIFGFPDDIPLDDIDSSEDSRSFDRNDYHFTKKSKLILGQVQQRRKQEEQEQWENTMAQIADRDPFNLSNDDYYAPKTTKQNIVFSGGSVIQHSIPAQNIHRAFFPTCLGPTRLRYFHRMPMQKRILLSLPIDTCGFTDIQSLKQHMIDMAEIREKKKISEAGLDVFPVRVISDLSAKDGTLLLLEYSEEHPPLLNQPGMASKIRNYYKMEDVEMELELEFGETAYTHTFPFLGNLHPGQHLQAIENNMFRAPIFQHTPKTTDYLLIKRGNSLILRKCPIPFVVGQECPLQEVPNPISKKASVFVRDFLLAFIYRLFWASKEKLRRLKRDDIKAAFPHYDEASVLERLEKCSFVKNLKAGEFWVLKKDFRLPSKEEVLAMITPEMCCANYSMLAAEQRLKDAGYEKKYICAGVENDSDHEVTIEDDIKCAPWNTTRAFLAAEMGKCVLDQSGIADPTGCGAGYSYVRVTAKPQKEDAPPVQKRLVNGTNADFRKLPLKKAKEVCKELGVRDEEINAMSRWEIIGVIRRLSTQAAKARSDLSGLARFARGNIRLNYADMNQEYKQYCQRIFDLQNKTLSNAADLSSDDGSSAEEDEQDEEMVARLEKIVTTALGKNSSLSSRSKKPLPKKSIKKKVGDGSEQKDFDDLMRMVHGEDSKPSSSLIPPNIPGPSTSAEKESLPKSLLNYAPVSDEMVVTQNLESSRKALQSVWNRDNKMKKLKIVRTFRDAGANEVVHSEIISNLQLTEAYVKIRTTKNERFIRNKALPKPKKDLKIYCSACGEQGHAKSNRNCPEYGKYRTELKRKMPKNAIKAIKNQEGTGDLRTSFLTGDADNDGDDDSDDEGRTLKSKKSMAGIIRRRSAVNDVDHLAKSHKSIPRRRADPKVTMATALEGIFLELKNLSDSEELMYPVSEKDFPDYNKSIKNPMTLQRIHRKITSNSYQLRNDFIKDFVLILENCNEYFGKDHDITKSATNVINAALQKIQENESTLIEIEKRINPLLNEDDVVGLSYLLEEIIDGCKNIPKSAAFHAKVDVKKAPKYYDIVINPMHFGMILQNIKERKYLTVGQFRRDMEQIKINSETYNGVKNIFTLKAIEILNYVDASICQRGDILAELEANIRRKKADEGVPIIEEEEFSLDSILKKDVKSVVLAPSPTQLAELDTVKEDPDRSMAEIIDVDDEKTRAGSDDDMYGDIKDDFDLSFDDNEDDDEMPSQVAAGADSDSDTDDDEAARDNFANLVVSNMSEAGKFSKEQLALSSSSDDDSDMISAKRRRLDDDFEVL